MWSKLFTTVKYLLVTVNLIFLVAGIVVLAVGGSVQSAYNGYHEFLTERFFSLPAFCIATGIIIVIVSIFGFYGAYMENYYLNMAFAVAMIVIFLFQLSACIAGYVLQSNTVALVQKQLLSTMDLYGVDKNVEVTKLWDEVQEDAEVYAIIECAETNLQRNYINHTIYIHTDSQAALLALSFDVIKVENCINKLNTLGTSNKFSCCGVVNSSDWLNYLNTMETQELPVSCCSHIYGTVAKFTCNTTLAYYTGCSQAFGTWVRDHAGVIGAAGVFLVLMQTLVVIGALWMAKISREEHAFP